MYPVSSAFHEAVRNGNRQMPLLIFEDCVFTSEDIKVDSGLEFHDYFNTETDISIGETPSNELSFTLFNDDRLLNDYTFGEFLATIGVLLEEDTYKHRGFVTVTTGHAQYVGNNTAPYLTRGGTAVASQPVFPVQSLLAYDGKVWCFGNEGEWAVYNDSDGSNITGSNSLNAFMKHKSAGWSGKGIYYNKKSRILFIYQGGTRERYEFCPLGYFTAERPNVPDKIEIDFTCYDRMQNFEQDMPTASEMGMTYPNTIGGLFFRMCAYAEVPTKVTDFINSDADITSEPEEFDSVTMRTVLGWIAEAACANAKVDRDGYMCLKWLENTSQSFDESGYSSLETYWYATKAIDKLYNRDTSSVSDTIVGSGDNAYLIQDNPLLSGAVE